MADTVERQSGCRTLKTWTTKLTRERKLRLAAAIAVPLSGWFARSAQAKNDAWSTSPASANFSGTTNWTVNSTTPGTGNGTAASTDALFFGNSTLSGNSTSLTLNNDDTNFTFAGLTFNTGATAAYTINGNAFTLTGAITNNSTNTQTINNAITLGNSQLFNAASGQMVFGGNITGANSLALTPTNKITLAGTNNFAAPASGSFVNFTVNAGAGGVDITGSTTVGNGGNTNQNGYLSVGGNTTVTIQSGGSLTINGSTNTVPNSIVGQVTLGTSTLLLNGGNFTIGGNTGFALGNANTTGVTGVLTITSGTATITRGSTTATDIRSFIAMGRGTGNGTINLNGGTLATDRNFVRDSFSSVDTSNSAIFNFGGGTLKALANQTDWLNSATINTNQRALSSVTATGTSTIDANSFSVAINSAISGAGGFNINSSTGTGTVTFGGVNSYGGGTAVNAGTLTVGSGGTLGATTGALTVNNPNIGAGTNVILNLATGADTTTGSLSGTITTPSSGTNTATINNGGSPRNFTVNQTSAGAFAGVISGSGNFTLGALSTNTLTLSGTNLYSGTTTISAGTLRVNGSLASGSAVTVSAGASNYGGARLGGTGTVNGTVALGVANTTAKQGGIITAGPDDSNAGKLTTGAEAWRGGAVYRWKITNAGTGVTGAPVTTSAQTGGSSTTFDDLAIGGALAVGSAGSPISVANGNAFTIQLSSLTGNQTTPTATTGFDATKSYSWVIGTVSSISLNGAGQTISSGSDTKLITGVNTDLFALDTSGFNLGTAGNALPAGVSGFELDAIGLSGTSANIVLSYDATPEPGTAMLILAGAVPMLSARRRRRKLIAIAENS